MLKHVLKCAFAIVAGLALLAASLGHYRPQVPYKNQVAVLMYHHIHDTDTSSATISTRLFQDQLTYLKAQGYHFITLDDLKGFLNGGAVPPGAVLVTFDDGYKSVKTNALPILEKMNIPAVIFYITQKQEHPEKGIPPFQSNEDIRGMLQETSLVDIGSHTHNLHNKTGPGKGEGLLVARLKNNGKTETEEEYEKRITTDLSTSLERLQALTSKKVDTLAYPYGIFDRKSIDLAKEAGIHYAFTITQRMTLSSTDPMQIPRINAGSPNITPELLDKTIRRETIALPGVINWLHDHLKL
ncbi:polysaccharide deacetylase family protein [Gorillibacterium massiliense]|uniref:polysaccharide deacetylase family protein n=1 Tax=Gorillibacterium massiliense TaxID=1280390 RepID=UPI0004B46859|nr:polysaccharide deacetylase family protein [Gorillibacterium massiliense]